MQRVNYFKKISTLLILLTLLCTQVAFTKVDLPVVPMAMLKLGSSLQSAIIFEKSKGDYFAVTTSLDKVNLASKTIYLYRNGEKVGSESIKLVANDQIRNFSLWKLKKAVRLDKRYKLVTRQKIYDGLDKSHSVGFWSSFIENGKSLTEITDGVVQFFNFKGHNALPGFNSSLVFIGAEGGMEGSAVTIKQKNGDYQIAGMISGYSERFNSKSNLHYFINRGAAIPFPQLWGAIKATINDYQQNPSHVSSGCFYASDVMSDLVELDTNFSMKELFCWQDQVRLSLKTSTLSFQGIEFRLINSNNYNVIEQDSAIYRCQLKAESKHLNLGSGLEIARAGGGPDVAGAGGGPDVAGAG
ncbi:MAG: hypothetical protein HON90_18160, partial [Halobacteriovoraceae bacterium]|nr:hypothetical protein [Halobacteriovoraceae bacterium]